MEITYYENVDILDVKFITTSTIGYTLQPGIYEISDVNFMLQALLPKEVKVNVAIDDIRLRSNLYTNKTIEFTKKLFFTTLGFTQSHSGSLIDIEAYVQIIPEICKSNKPINNTGIAKILLKRDCINRRIVYVVRETIFFSFGLNKSPGNKIFNQLRNECFKIVKRSVLSQITFYLEDDDHKTVDFNGETISFTCHLNKI